MPTRSEEVLALIEQYKSFKEKNPLQFIKYYDWQKDCMNATNSHIETTMICANRVGKSLTSCSIIAFNLLGEYPDWYEGFKLERPGRILLTGVSGGQIRDVIQSILIGDIDPITREFKDGGLIPKERLISPVFDAQTKGLLREIRVIHKKGFTSIVKFRSYSQGPHILRGPYYDAVLIDEEPLTQGLEFYSECLMRISLGNNKKGGRLIISLTPEMGLTELVDRLYNHVKPHQYLKTVGWDDITHLSKEVKENLLSSIPAHLIPAKCQGRPTWGENRVFKCTEEEIICDPFPIPDHYYLLAGVDFGVMHPFACAFVALDRDKNIVYLFDGFEMIDSVPGQHCARINQQFYKIPISFPHDALNREKGSGETLKDEYIKYGANMAAQFHNSDGTNHVEPGILKMDQMMKEGTLKIFSNCKPFWDSFRKFRRNPKNGKLVEDGKDFMDAARYSILMVHQYGVQKNAMGISKFKGKSYPQIYPRF